MSKWTDISGTLIVEAGVDEDGDWYLENQKELPYDVIEGLYDLFPNMEEGEYTIKIHFLSSGSYTPARVNAPVEDCYPSEYEDTRKVDDVEVRNIDDVEGNGKYLSPPAAQSFASLFEEEINAVEIDFQGEHYGNKN